MTLYVPSHLHQTCTDLYFHYLQEDEAEQLARKQAAEEQFIDIGEVTPVHTRAPSAPPSNMYSNAYSGPGAEEDAAWADEEPDEDMAGWQLKVLIDEDNNDYIQ